MSDALAVAEGHAIERAPRASQLTTAEVKWQLEALIELQKEVMVQGHDYGIIPGTNKPTLYKPGAEMICVLYKLSPDPEIVYRHEDYDRPFFAYEARVRLVSRLTGEVVAGGIGQANSFERRYMNRTCYARKVEHRQRNNKDVHTDACYERHTPESFDYALVNTLEKMAKKRAFIDAVLTGTMASRLFSQDTEDLSAGVRHVADDAPRAAAPAQPDARGARAIEVNKLRDELGVSIERFAEIIRKVIPNYTTGKLTIAELDKVEAALRAYAAEHPPEPAAEPATATEPQDGSQEARDAKVARLLEVAAGQGIDLADWASALGMPDDATIPDDAALLSILLAMTEEDLDDLANDLDAIRDTNGADGSAEDGLEDPPF